MYHLNPPAGGGCVILFILELNPAGWGACRGQGFSFFILDLNPPGCRCPNMRRRTQPACIFGRRSSCGALNMRRIRDDACIFRPLRQRRLAAAPAPPRCIVRRTRFGCAALHPLDVSPLSLRGSPLALSQFSLRATARPCENWSAAPSTPRCICRRQRFGVLAPGLRARPHTGALGL